MVATLKRYILALVVVANATLATGCRRYGCADTCAKYYGCIAPAVEQTFGCELRTDATCEWSKECRDCVERSECRDLPSPRGTLGGTFPDCLEVCPDLPRE